MSSLLAERTTGEVRRVKCRIRNHSSEKARLSRICPKTAVSIQGSTGSLIQHQHLMNLQRRQLDDGAVGARGELRGEVARLDEGSADDVLPQVDFDAVDGNGFFSQRNIDGGEAVVGGRVQAVEEVQHEPIVG